MGPSSVIFSCSSFLGAITLSSTIFIGVGFITEVPYLGPSFDSFFLLHGITMILTLEFEASLSSTSSVFKNCVDLETIGLCNYLYFTFLLFVNYLIFHYLLVMKCVKLCCPFFKYSWIAIGMGETNCVLIFFLIRNGGFYVTGWVVLIICWIIFFNNSIVFSPFPVNPDDDSEQVF